MSVNALHVLATEAGIVRQWTDAQGQAQCLRDATLLRLLTALGLPADTPQQRAQSLNALRHEQRAPATLLVVDADAAVALPTGMEPRQTLGISDESGNVEDLILDATGRWRAPSTPGYYTLHSSGLHSSGLHGSGLHGGGRRFAVAVAPRRCFTIADALARDAPRCWGLAAQVYALRRPGDGGAGDSGAVATLAAHIARSHGDALALSPLHALSPRVTSPYFPSHRGYFNWLLADPGQVLGAATVRAVIAQSGMAQAWHAAEHAALIDWPLVAGLRHRLWRALHALLPALPETLRQDHADFIRAGGQALRAHALFTGYQRALPPCAGSTPGNGSDGVAARLRLPVAGTDADAEFELFAQWLARRCWERTAHLARTDGLALGLIIDLAVGFDPAGSEAASHSDTLLAGLTLGAPPDAFNWHGQNWGVTSYAPRALRRCGFAPFIAILRANMRVGGGLRMDHVLGLSRLWVIPEGMDAKAGGYLASPLADLLRLLALESWRHRCVVIGEDLGTVPAGLRATLATRGVLGMDALLFNRDADGGFVPSSQWRRAAVSMTTTHDTPPLAGWRAGRDLAWRADIEACPDAEANAAREARARDVRLLDQAVGTAGRAAPPAGAPATVDWQALRFTARSPGPLLLLPMEDALGLHEQPNLPGTTGEHPNWRRRLPASALTDAAPAMAWINHCRAPAAGDD